MSEQQVLSKQLKELMDQHCDECGCPIHYEIEGDIDTNHEFWLAGMCTNHNCEREFNIQPTAWERE